MAAAAGLPRRPGRGHGPGPAAARHDDQLRASTGQQDAAAAVLRAIGGPHADTRLQIIVLEDELARTPADADDDLLRLHHALAANYGVLGDYRAGTPPRPARNFPCAAASKATTTPTP